MRRLALLLVLAAPLVFGGCNWFSQSGRPPENGGATTTVGSRTGTDVFGGNATNFQLKPREGSGLAGAATVAKSAGGSRFTIHLQAGSPGSGVTAAIYDGPCRQLPHDAVTKKVSVTGTDTSFSTGIPVDRFRTKYESLALERNGTVLSCGDVPPGPVAAAKAS